jgi:hypothetical protein
MHDLFYVEKCGEVWGDETQNIHQVESTNQTREVFYHKSKALGPRRLNVTRSNPSHVEDVEQM